MTVVLGIESSCDETGVALVETGPGGAPRLLGEALHSQVAMHADYGGVVPELASRDHIRRVIPLARQALEQAQRTLADVDFIAYTRGPGLAGALLGVPLGVFLRLTDRGGVLENRAVNAVTGAIVNAVRSTPFIILLVAIIPFTRFVVGSSIGTAAAIVPLTISAIPFVARLVETALREVDSGLVEAAQAMGASTRQIVFKVLLPEALPGIVAGLTIMLVSLTGYSAMAGAIGGGGLGDLGIRYGYQRFLPDVMLAVVVILIVFVQLLQSLGDWAVRKLSHK